MWWAFMLPVIVVGVLLIPAMVLVRRHSLRDLAVGRQPEESGRNLAADRQPPRTLTRVR